MKHKHDMMYMIMYEYDIIMRYEGILDLININISISRKRKPPTLTEKQISLHKAQHASLIRQVNCEPRLRESFPSLHALQYPIHQALAFTPNTKYDPRANFK